MNDFGSATEAAWKADILYTVDAIEARWPQITIYITKPWKGPAATWGATADTFAGWIDDLIASRTFLVAGDDERVWLEGGDDGATMTTDSVHYSAAGEAEKVVQMRTLLGYPP